MPRYCQECGGAMDDSARFCPSCGASIAPAENVGSIQQLPDLTTDQPSPGILRDKDDVLRWVYEFSLYRNPTILVLVWKIFFFIFLGLYVFLVLLEIGDGIGDALAGLTPVFLGLIGGMFILSTIAYCLYALMMGGKYCVLFEMDEKGVKHTQMPRQFKKAQILGNLLLLAGAATGSVGAAGQGLLVGSKQSTYSKFKQVRVIKPDRKRQVIKVNSSDLVHNQVYAEAADFDFVLSFIETHVVAAQSKSRTRSR